MNLYLMSIKKIGENNRTTFEIEGKSKKDALDNGRIHVLQNPFYNPWFYDTHDVRVEKKMNKKKLKVS